MSTDKIKETAHNAIVSFWNEVASAYPKITTGELSISSILAFDEFAEDVITEWLEANSQEASA